MSRNSSRDHLAIDSSNRQTRDPPRPSFATRSLLIHVGVPGVRTTACVAQGLRFHCSHFVPVSEISLRLPHFAERFRDVTAASCGKPNTKSRSAMRIKLTLRQWTLSTLVFGGVLFALASVDARVRERVSDVMTGGDGLTPWGDRVSDLGNALMFGGSSPEYRERTPCWCSRRSAPCSSSSC